MSRTVVMVARVVLSIYIKTNLTLERRLCLSSEELPDNSFIRERGARHELMTVLRPAIGMSASNKRTAEASMELRVPVF